jgi:hypothetical protein
MRQHLAAAAIILNLLIFLMATATSLRALHSIIPDCNS